ncbi:hypothetical protein EDB84DRAFT_1675565 [Lactarius hengduanensis]|nr:hypothetical protein EDB84DRAFT_1675565 [Lactarius hengduanensis]
MFTRRAVPVAPPCCCLSTIFFNKLMISLGYIEYVTQGGDSAHVESTPDFLIFAFPNSRCEPRKLFGNPIVLLKCSITSGGSRFLKPLQEWQGYFAEQSTVHQAADNRIQPGRLARRLARVDIREARHISICWFSRAGPAASIRIYYELALSGEVIAFPKTTVPVGLSFFPKDLVRSPKALLRSKGRIVFESKHKVGGYFAAYEQPEALVGDLRKMFRESGPATGVVPGYTGY